MAGSIRFINVAQIGGLIAISLLSKLFTALGFSTDPINGAVIRSQSTLFENLPGNVRNETMLVPNSDGKHERGADKHDRPGMGRAPGDKAPKMPGLMYKA
ncbi:hypothetical protein TSTA_117180 [Talaromyces stipitatus ATCC 10500]|uniref:Uncharacterized protein n=1 Tax=Talaromyces stipitatus (strain ATCC 10500 / CBS 375.48 / QM 6759 / NRRL 1006) TaxID=441959 RepID=B8MDG9_TALSN|nr:uncharacterized protein TSTA_117180 [Talaromyces stipitatus ATCC 10500]EED17932.1 hypothetical protein TSTA_117180 [Talaromyces stipitatus ATCC 10500]